MRKSLKKYLVETQFSTILKTLLRSHREITSLVPTESNSTWAHCKKKNPFDVEDKSNLAAHFYFIFFLPYNQRQLLAWHFCFCQFFFLFCFAVLPFFFICCVLSVRSLNFFPAALFCRFASHLLFITLHCYIINAVPLKSHNVEQCHWHCRRVASRRLAWVSP